MNRKKRLTAWIVAFVMVWVQLPTVQVMATNFDLQQQGNIVGEEVKKGTVLKAGKDVIINTATGTAITVYYVDAEENWLATEAINKANGQDYAQYTVETVNSISNWEVNIISESGGAVDQIQLIPYKSVNFIDIDALDLPNKISGGIGYKCYQLTAEVLPEDAENKSVAWAVYDTEGIETDKAILSDDSSTLGAKLLEVKEAGTYTVRALAEDGCDAVDNQILTVSINVSGITINSASSVVKGNTLNMGTVITPSNATNTKINWTVTPTGNATIDSSGLLTATAAGTVTVTATSDDNANASDTKVITITEASIPVSGITVHSTNNATSVVRGGTLNMRADITPNNATQQDINWSIVQGGTGSATINNDGVLTATAVGTVTVKATSASNTNVSGTMVITITAPADNSSDDSSSDNSGSNTTPTTPTDPFQALSASDRSAIIDKLKEYLPYTLLESKGLTVEILDTLTDHKFTKEYLETLVKDPELIKKTFGVDVKAMIEYISLEPIENPSFSDISSHWAKDNIVGAAQQGFVAGLPDGSFAPDQALQAADTLTFLNRVLLDNDIVDNKLPRSTVDKYLKDFKGHWAYASMASVCAKLDEKTVKAIAELGDKPMTRELLAQIVYELTKDQIKPIAGRTFSMPDINGSPYKNALLFCAGTELLYGTSQTTMSPTKALTRAELMAILTRLDTKLRH